MFKKLIKKTRHLMKTKAAGKVIYFLARLYSATLRLRVENEEAWRPHLEAGGRVLICAWHQQIFIGVKLFRRYRKYSACVMISRSHDGDVAGRVAEAANVFPVRGSSSRGGATALKEIIAFIKNNGLGVHLIDGPRGPAGVVKPGAIAIAQGAGAMIIPAHVTADRVWHVRSWDRFMIPKPFARVTVTFHPAMNLDATDNDFDFEQQRKRLEDTLKPYLWGV